MYDQDLPERTTWLEPKIYETIGYCCECSNAILAGDDVWEIRSDWWCEACIDDCRTTKYEAENCYVDED